MELWIGMCFLPVLSVSILPGMHWEMDGEMITYWNPFTAL